MSSDRTKHHLKILLNDAFSEGSRGRVGTARITRNHQRYLADLNEKNFLGFLIDLNFAAVEALPEGQVKVRLAGIVEQLFTFDANEESTPPHDGDDGGGAEQPEPESLLAGIEAAVVQ
jgi:hypothetical protein